MDIELVIKTLKKVYKVLSTYYRLYWFSIQDNSLYNLQNPEDMAFVLGQIEILTMMLQYFSYVGVQGKSLELALSLLEGSIGLNNGNMVLYGEKLQALNTEIQKDIADRRGK